jgi:MFS family permease
MFRRFSFLNTMLPLRLNAAVRDLYISTAIQNFALATVAIFEPVYLYESGYRLTTICLFYLGVYVLYILLLPLGMKFSLHFGYEKGMVVGSLLWVALYLCLALSVANSWLLLLAVVVYAVQKAFYWPGFHADFAQYSVDEEQGRELGGITFLQLSVAIAGPVVGGIILASSGFTTLFIVVAMLLLVSNVPFFIRPERFKPEHMSYGDLWRHLFEHVNWRWTVASLGYGEELVALVIWPIAMSIVMAQNSILLGSLIGATALITAVSAPVLGRLSDQLSPRSVLRYSTWMYFFSWLVRVLAISPFGVLVTDAMSRVSKNGLGVSYTQLLYQKARADGRVMTRVMTFELGLAIGKAVVAGLLALAFFFGAQLSFAFGVAALCTLLYLVRTHE